MSATPRQLRAVADAMTPEAFLYGRPWDGIMPLLPGLTLDQHIMVESALLFGNLLLWQAVALRLRLEAALADEQAENGGVVARNQCGHNSIFCADCSAAVGSPHEPWCHRNDRHIAAIVRAGLGTRITHVPVILGE